MNLFEQDQRQQKEIAKHKKEGYKPLTQKEWKKKKQTDPNGKFVNVETFFYGYIASATPPAPKPVETEKEKKDVKSYSEVKLPFTKTSESDAFRAWLLSKFPDYGDEVKMTKSFKVDKAPSKYKTSNALKNAYFCLLYTSPSPRD